MPSSQTWTQTAAKPTPTLASTGKNHLPVLHASDCWSSPAVTSAVPGCPIWYANRCFSAFRRGTVTHLAWAVVVGQSVILRQQSPSLEEA